jgi:hypothetical protein
VTVCALAAVPDNAISARHGKAARKTRARLFRPVAGPAITIEILQQKQLLDRHPREPARNAPLMELKQLWLMSR